MTPRARQLLSLVALGCAAVGVGAALAASGALPRVSRYGVFEQTFRFASRAANPWDPTSAMRMRLRAWTAFFAEATIVFWNTSATKDYLAEAGNIYLGPEERGYIRVLSRYMSGFDSRARVVTASVSDATGLRAYALLGPAAYGLYLVDGVVHSAPVAGARIVVDPARAGRATWTDPATGRTLAAARVPAGRQALSVPQFTTDVALKIAPG